MFTTRLAIHCQGMRLFKIHHAWMPAHITQEFHLHCCFPPKDTHGHIHWPYMSTTQLKASGPKLSQWAVQCSFAITGQILFSFFSSTYLYAQIQKVILHNAHVHVLFTGSTTIMWQYLHTHPQTHSPLPTRSYKHTCQFGVPSLHNDCCMVHHQNNAYMHWHW